MSVLLAALALGCTPPGKPNPADKPELPSQIISFDQLFATNCAGCHGQEGKFGPAPPLNDPLFEKIVPDKDLELVIRDGRQGTPMPPFLIDKGGSLTQKQIDVLVAGLKSHWHSDAAVPESPPAYQLTQTGSAERGAQVFARACAGCHGPNGIGGEHAAPHEHATAGPIHVPAFLALISNQAIRRIIITGRPDLHMPNYAETDGRPDDFQPLTSAEIDDVVALIAEWRSGSAIAQANNK